MDALEGRTHQRQLIRGHGLEPCVLQLGPVAAGKHLKRLARACGDLHGRGIGERDHHDLINGGHAGANHGHHALHHQLGLARAGAGLDHEVAVAIVLNRRTHTVVNGLPIAHDAPSSSPRTSR